MPSALAPHPSLTPPVLLGSYTRAAQHSRAGSSFIQSHSASSSRVSHASTGEVVRISQGTVRRARGLVVTLAAGHSVSLVETGGAHSAIQSFPLAQNAQPCTPPLTVVRSSVRTTYLGVADQHRNKKGQAAQTEIWAWREDIKREEESGNAHTRAPTRLVARCEGNITSLHPLASGEVLLRGSDGGLQLLSTSESTSEEAASSLSIAPLQPSTGEPSRHIVHSISVLDPSASTQLFAGRLPREYVLATIVTFTSKAKSSAAKTTAATTPIAAEKKRGRRKTAIEMIDDAEGGAEGDHTRLIAFGEITVEVCVVLDAATQGDRVVAAQKSAFKAVKDAGQVVDLHLYHNGSVSVLTRSGDLLLSHLEVSKALQPLVSAPRTIGIAHIHPADISSRPAAIVRLSASHLLVVLVAQGGPSNGRMAALIWDTELEALLVASDWSVPSAAGLAESNRHLNVSASRVGRSQVLVNSEFWGTSDGEEEVSLAAVWALPFSIPAEGSVLRHAIGKAALTSSWSKAVGAVEGKAAAGSSKRNASGLDTREAHLIQELEASGNAADMETKFTAWISEETTRIRQAWEKERLQVEKDRVETAAGEGSDSDDSDEDNEAKEEPTAEATAGQKARAPKLSLSHSFVSALLSVSLPPSKSQRPYVRKIVSYLVDRRAVSNSMLASTEQSLLSRLQAHNDWAQIMNVVRIVTDLGEVEIVGLLQSILRYHNSGEAQEDLAPTARPPSVDVFLSQFITMAVSRPLLRSTLHGRVTDAKDVCLLLDTTTQWLKGRYYEPLEVDSFAEDAQRPQQQQQADGSAPPPPAPSTPGQSRSARRKRLGRQQHSHSGPGTPHQISIAGTSTAKAPPTKDLVQFATDLIDVYFPLLLTTPATHRSLRALSQAITAHLTLCDELSNLRGPLDAYARLESDRKRITQELERRRTAAAAMAFRDPRKARSAGGVGPADDDLARAETGGGLALPDLNKSARLRAFEASALVGPHTVEILEI